jgi:YD repeat-containing protein
VRVVVSGWQTFNNKGRVIQKYESFYSTGWDYLAREDAPPTVFGQKVTMFFDGLGRLVRTVNPDGSEQRVVYGVPGTRATPDLADPDVFEPTAWETNAYDANDNDGRTDPVGSGRIPAALEHAIQHRDGCAGADDCHGRTQRTRPDYGLVHHPVDA